MGAGNVPLPAAPFHLEICPGWDGIRWHASPGYQSASTVREAQKMVAAMWRSHGGIHSYAAVDRNGTCVAVRHALTSRQIRNREKAKRMKKFCEEFGISRDIHRQGVAAVKGDHHE